MRRFQKGSCTDDQLNVQVRLCDVQFNIVTIQSDCITVQPASPEGGQENFYTFSLYIATIQLNNLSQKINTCIQRGSASLMYNTRRIGEAPVRL